MMQAAGRLRMLGRGQKLHFAAPADVTAKIKSFARRWGRKVQEPSPPQILQWVMHNTVQATLHGVVEWAKLGLFYASTYGKPENVVEDEVLDVATLYQSSRSEVHVAHMIKSMSNNSKMQSALLDDGHKGEIVKYRSSLYGDILRGSVLHGKGYKVVSGSTADEEVERELEKEEEEEVEVERELERMQPAREADWDFLSVFGASAVAEVDQNAKVQPLTEMIKELSLSSQEVKSLAWSKAADKVLTTSNFRSTISAGVQDEYLRQVRAMLLFHSGETLLISEREADALLEQKWRGAGSISTLPPKSVKQHGPLLLNLSYAQQFYAAVRGTTGSSQSPAARYSPRLACELSFISAGRYSKTMQLPAVKIPDENSLVIARLFDGSTTYSSRSKDSEWKTQQLAVLHRFMRRKLLAAEELTGLRGKRGMLLRSDLGLACGDTLPAAQKSRKY
jgi:hypothetical protein